MSRLIDASASVQGRLQAADLPASSSDPERTTTIRQVTPSSVVPAWIAPSGLYNAAVDMIDRNVSEGRGSKVAFIDPSTKLTYGELAERVNRFGSAILRLGIARERRVVLIKFDTVDLVVAFWGAIKAGVVPIPINTLLPAETWRYIIEDSRADAVVISSDLHVGAKQVLDEIGKRRQLHVIVDGGSSK